MILVDTSVLIAFLQSAETHDSAARLYLRCRRRGITVRSTLDVLIAMTAIRHGLLLLHEDRDYERIAAVEPRLRFFQV